MATMVTRQTTQESSGPTSCRAYGRIRTFLRWVWKHYVLILMIYLPLQAFVNFAVHWDRPDYGFSQFGVGVFLTCLFPVIWLMIYTFCGVIARQNELLAEARRQISQSDSLGADGQTEVDHDRCRS